MKLSDKPLFYNSSLLFSEKSMEILQKSKVAMAGLGGVGAITAEMLARQGIGNFKVADSDLYEQKNKNRQIFAINETIGLNKAVVAGEKIKSINSDACVKVYDFGITLDNVEEFCSNSDVVLAQVDKESIKIILHRTAKKLKIPVICGSRNSLQESRWFVSAKIWDYSKNPDLPCYDVTNHPDMAKIPIEDMTEEMLKEFDEKIKTKKMKLFNDYIVANPELFRSISQKDLVERISENNNYFNRHVCAVIANTGGILAATATVRYLLGGPEGKLEIDLWDGDA